MVHTSFVTRTASWGSCGACCTLMLLYTPAGSLMHWSSQKHQLHLMNLRNPTKKSALKINGNFLYSLGPHQNFFVVIVNWCDKTMLLTQMVSIFLLHYLPRNIRIWEDSQDTSSSEKHNPWKNNTRTERMMVTDSWGNNRMRWSVSGSSTDQSNISEREL